MAIKKKNTRKIKIIETKLGQQQALGIWEPDTTNTAVIRIDERLRGFQRLMIIIHESLHEVCPDWDEKKVVDNSEILASLLWKCGYRFTDHAGEDVPVYTHPAASKSKKKPLAEKTYNGGENSK